MDISRRLSIYAAMLLACIVASGTAAAEHGSPLSPNAVVAFSPCGKSLELILRAVEDSRQSIHIAAYSLSSKPIALALLAAHKRNVHIRIIVDGKAARSRYSVANFLANGGVSVKVNSNYAILHHKFMVFDGRHVETGSFNYTEAAASKNAENVLFLKNVPELAKDYMTEWQRLWDEGIPLEARY